MSDEQYNKRVVFRENDTTHANLRVRLHYDGVKQSQFFRGCIDAYLNQDKDFMAFMETLKSEKGSLSKLRNEKSKKLRELLCFHLVQWGTSTILFPKKAEER